MNSTMRRSIGFVLLTSMSAGVVSVPPAAAQPATDTLLEQVRTAWAKRQDAVRSLRVTWTSRTTTPKGAYSILTKRPGYQGPPADAVHDGTGELLISGVQVRIMSQGMMLGGDKGEFVQSRFDSVFDGTRYTRLLGPGVREHPTAATKATDHNADGDDMTISPVFVAVRGHVPALARLVLANYTWARQVVVAGRALVELTKPRDETRGEAKLWVDPAQEFATVRMESYDRQGGLTAKTTVDNTVAPGQPACWLPGRWNSAAYIPAGKLAQQVEVATETRVVNPGMSSGDFQLALPAGTFLTEEAEKKSQHSIVRADGTKRVVLPSEVGTPYEQLVRTDPGTPRSGALWAWGWTTGLGLLIGVGSLLVLFRKRLFFPRGGTTPPPPPSP